MIYIFLVVFIIGFLLFYNRKDLNKRFIINIFLAITLILSLLLATNYILVLVPFDFIRVAHDNDWISFWGSFLGGVISGIATLIVIYLTIKTSRELNKDIIEANTKDVNNTLAQSDNHFKINLLDQRRYFVDDTTRKVHPHFVVNKTFDSRATKIQRFDMTNEEDDDYITHPDAETLRITNVGIGTALEVELELIKETNSYYKAIYFFDEFQNLVGRSNLFIEPNSSADLEINYDNRGIRSKGRIAFYIVYRDIYKNKWKQKVFIQTDNDNEWIIMHVDPPKCDYLNEFIVDKTKLP